MAEYIDKKQAIDRIASCYCIDCEHSNGILCRACEHQDDMDLIDEMPTADVQPVDTNEILRHLDSMMICISNAYNTSHFLLESDMKFIERQEKIIKELLSGMKGEENG